MMKDDDFKLWGVFAFRQTDEQTDICNCRIAFATEKNYPEGDIGTFSFNPLLP